VSYVPSAIIFWVWKFLPIQEHWEHSLRYVFLVTFGVGLVFSLLFGSLYIFRSSYSRSWRIVAFVALLFAEAYVGLMAALGANFVDQ
jgi:hypothetical protein